MGPKPAVPMRAGRGNVPRALDPKKAPEVAGFGVPGKTVGFFASRRRWGKYRVASVVVVFLNPPRPLFA